MEDPHVSATVVAARKLHAVVKRIERLEAEKTEIADQIKEVYAEAKAQGFDTATLRKVVALRKKDLSERDEETAMIDLYLRALNMIPEAA